MEKPLGAEQDRTGGVSHGDGGRISELGRGLFQIGA
jgi:hypothetical protein